MAEQFFNVGMQPENEAPTARVYPAQQRSIIGATARLDGRTSSDPQGDPLTYIWNFVEIPIGSTLTLADLEDLAPDSSAVGFAPDITGVYIVGLVVSDGQYFSSRARAVVNVQVVQVPLCSDILPDGRFFFRVLSDHLQHMENSELLPIVWSGFQQQAAAVLLDAYQADYSKSIHTILETQQRRWELYSPRIDLSTQELQFLFGGEDDGASATTGTVGEPASGYLLSAREFVVVAGAVKPSSSGKTLRLLTSEGANIGSYTLAGVGRRSLTYLVERTTPFPDVAGEQLGSGADLNSVIGSAVVTTPATNFTLIVGLDAGDVIRIPSGPNAGSYLIDAVGVPTPLSLTLDRPLAATRTDTYVLYNTVSALIETSASNPYTDVVSVPAGEGDFTLLDGVERSGLATIRSTREIAVGETFTSASAVGRSLRVFGAQTSGQFVISGVNSAGDGYLIAGKFTGTFPQEGVSYRLPAIATVEGRLLVLNDRAYTIRRARNDTAQLAPPLGPGPVSLAVVDRPSLVSGVAGLRWRIPATLYTRELDLEELGVRAGDVLTVQVQHVTSGRAAEVSCTIVGSDRERAAVVVGTQDLTNGGAGGLTDTEKVELALALGISGASYDELGNPVLAGLALDIDTALSSLGFQTRYDNLPHTGDTVFEAAGESFKVEAVSISRNTLIPVDEEVVSVPCMREYVGKVYLAQNDDSTFDVLTRDGVRTTIPRAPVDFVENRDYVIEGEIDLTGVDGSTTAGSEVFTSLTGSFISRNVEVGDTVEVEEEDFVVLQVLSETQLQAVRTSTGSVFLSTLTDLTYTVRRRSADKYIRFVPGIFSPTSPTPENLWAEVTFVDNSEAIENNFGTLVALTREQLSNQETSSTTYREAVLGLMYAWANGPTLNNLRLGAQILLGLPAADVRGVVRAVKDDYRVVNGVADLGRLLVEDLDADGTPTGLVRVYFYKPLVDDALDDYTGIEINPATGTAYDVDDIVERFAPLGKGVIVTDYVEDPDWWRGKFLQGDTGAELRKFHTWTLRANVDVTDPDDLLLVDDFASAMDPAWTDVEVVMVKPLADDITIEDDLYFAIRDHIVDDPFGRIEAVASMDALNGFGLNLQHLNVGPMNSRMFFMGKDLETPVGGAGPLTFTSARGGFIDPLVVVPYPGYSAITAEHGTPLVRPGDLLRIFSGPNEGWYLVAGVPTDTTVQVNPVPYDVPSPPLLGVQAGEDQEFFIFRPARNPIYDSSAVAAMEQTGVLRVVQDLTGVCFFTEGVTVDDRIRFYNGTWRGVYRIIEVIDPGVGVFPWAQLRLDPEPPASVALFQYDIVRPVLETNPLVSSTVTSVGTNVVTLPAAAALDLQMLQFGDELKIETGGGAGTYQVVDTLSATTLYVRPAVPAGGPADATITRASLSEFTGMLVDQVIDFFPDTTLSMALYRPRSVVAAGFTVTSAGSSFTPSAPTGAAPGDFLQVEGGVDSGVYLLDAVGATLDVTAHLLGAGPENARVLQDLADFSVIGPGDQVVSFAAVDFSLIGVQPGDILEVFSGGAVTPGEYVIAEVVGGTLTLTRNLPLGAATGRILRVKR